MSYHEAWAGGGEMVQHADLAHETFHYLFYVIPGGAGTILLVVAWAFRKRIEAWIRKVVHK